MKVAIICCVFLFVVSVTAFFKDESPPTDEVQDMATAVRGDVEEQMHEHFPEFKVISFRKQAGNGHKYFIKVKVGSTYLHIKAYKNRSGKVAMADIDVGHTHSATDHLDSF